MRNWQLLLLPELRRFPDEERAAAIRDARDTELDLLELAGAGLALLLATWFTRYSLGEGTGGLARLLACLLNLAVALPLLVAGFLPFHLRRLRRGLREQLARRGSPR
jgi:hypothetical protein